VTRSHPPTLLRRVERALLGPCAIPSGAKLALAVSGGPDSMGLLHALSILRPRLGFELYALSIDHGLRPEAQNEVQLVAEWAARLEVPFRSAKLELDPGGNLQARARSARYEALWALAHAESPDCFLATAHHADDRAETVLLRLVRGTSPAGLDVLREREGQLLRPMIRACKADVLAHNERHGITSCKDPSNFSKRFLRVRVRHELLPLLQTLNPKIVESLCALADEVHGEPLGLSREQREQLRRALETSEGRVDVPLGRGLHVRRERTPAGPTKTHDPAK
jgi:tRNA(Ile)-lysidine synthase